MDLSINKAKNKIKIMFAAQDAGAASALVPVIRGSVKERGVLVVAAKFAVDILKRQGIEAVDCTAMDETSVERIFSDFAPDVLIVGTSAGMSIEKVLVRRARMAGVPSLAVVDAWSNYVMRFSSSEKSGDFNYLPDVVCVVDLRMKRECMAVGVPGPKIVITGNPHFGEAADSIVRAKRPHWDAVFISQPFFAIQQERPLLFDHITVLRDWFNCSQIKKFHKILIRLHPRDDLAMYEEFLKREKPRGLEVSLNKDGDLYELLGRARVVVGMNSLVLLDAIMAGLTVIRYQPGLPVGEDIFPKGLLPKWAETYDGVAFSRALDIALAGKNQRETVRLSALKNLCQPVKAVAMILRIAITESVEFKRANKKEHYETKY